MGIYAPAQSGDHVGRGQGSGVPDAVPGGAAEARPVVGTRRNFLGAFGSAVASVVGGGVALVSATHTADAAPNCMNVLVNDRYWASTFDVYLAVAHAGNLEPALAEADFVIDDVPTIGSLMVWGRRFGGASWTGHVGIVEVVNSDGTVVVKHENWPRGTREHLEVFEVQRGHRFIHPRPPEPGTVTYPDESQRQMWSARQVPEVD
jgi:surface antigen